MLNPTEITMFVLLIIGLFLIGIGVHNVDNSVNMILEENLNYYDLEDATMFGAFKTMDLYMIGQTMILIGAMVLVCAAMLGMCDYWDNRKKFATS